MERDEAFAIQDHRDEECTGSVQAGGSMPGTAWRRYGGSLVLALILALLGCGGGERDLTGTWAGTIQDSVAGVGTLLFTFTQTDTRLTGSWQTAFTDPRNNNAGTLSGTVGDPSIALVLSTSQPPACSFTVAANRDDENHFKGTYASFNCASPQSGSLDVTRQ
jgi:hypothetical protein